MHCLFNLQDCFLARRNWESVLLEGEEIPLPVVPGLAGVATAYLTILAKVPGILKYAWVMKEAMKQGMPIDMTKVPLLVRHAAKLRGELAAWFVTFCNLVAAPVEVPSKDPGSIFETVFEFNDTWEGSLYLGYWATMGILQECLNVCGYPVDYTETNKEFARNIFRSLETVGAGMMGPYRVGYAVRIAYEFADTRTQVWALGVLARFQQSYAAVSPDTYEKPGQNTYHEH